MKTQNDVQITIRVDKDVKERAESLFNRLGMNMSTALNVFLRKAVNKDGIPFYVSVKSPEFIPGYSAGDITEAFAASIQCEIAKKQKNGTPLALYDVENKKAYLEYPDGSRKYVNG